MIPFGCLMSCVYEGIPKCRSIPFQYCINVLSWGLKIALTPNRWLDRFGWSHIQYPISQSRDLRVGWLIESEWRIYETVNQSSLVQIMDCRLVFAKPLSEPMVDNVNWNPRNKLHWNFSRNSYIFIQQKWFQIIVGKMVGISSMC